MTKKVLIIGLNYSGALSGRINIAVNARGVFIADYGILEENITYLTDEWAPLTKAQITTAIQTLVSESSMLDELYVYYAGYGSGIRIVKTVDYGEVPVGSEPLVSVPLGSVPLGSVPLDVVPLGPISLSELLESIPLEVVPPDDTITISIDELSNTELSNTELSNTELSNFEVVPPAEPEILPQDPDILTPTEPLPTPTELEILPTTEPEEPLTYKYEFYPPSYSYDKLAKQMVGSDYEIIDTTEILSLLSNSRCRTICVLDMCDYKGIATPLMWGTDIIGNVNIISFAESDVVSSGKLATIQVITTHMSSSSPR